MLIVGIVLVGLLGGALIAWFHSLEQRGRRHTILVVVVTVFLAEALLAGPAALVPRGLLRPGFGGQDFRPVDVVLLAALAVRLLSAQPRVITATHGWWIGFLTIYGLGGVVGTLNGMPRAELLYQGKAAFYLLGGMVVASGIDLDRAYERIGLVARWLALLVPISFLLGTAGVRISFSTPVQRFNNLGRLSNDTVTLLTLLGAIVLICEVTRRERRTSVVAAGLTLLLSPLAAQQRASYLVLAAVLACIAVTIAGSAWKRRTTVTYVQIGLVSAGLIGVGLFGLVVTSSPDVVLRPIEDAFGGEAETRSAAARFDLADQAIDKIVESPVIGSGLGVTVERMEEFNNKSTNAAAHNVVLDVWMRVGVVGLLAFAAAVTSVVAGAGRAWRHSTHLPSAAFGLGAAYAIAGFLAKAMVEPALDKFRLAFTLALAVGVVVAIERRRREGADEPGTPLSATVSG